jgi:flotillin
MQEGEKAKFDADANIAGAQRDFQIKQAQFLAEVETQKATAAQAGPLSEAKAKQQVVVEEVRIEKMRTQEQIAVQEQEVLRKQKELEATVIKAAEADRQAAILRAEAAKQAAILQAEGSKASQIALAEAQQEKLRQEGIGRAAAVEAEGRAEAAKVEAIGLAQARAIEAQGVAEAQAILKKAEAWKQFNDAARLQTILERLPSVLQASAGIFGAVAAPLGNIDKVVVIEQGNGASGDSTGGIGRVARTGPALVFGLLQQLQALGLDVPSILSQLGVNGGKTDAAPKPPEAVSTEPKASDAKLPAPAPKIPLT